MTKRSIISLLIFSLAMAGFIAIGWKSPYCELSLGSDPRAWFPLVNVHFNAYHMWRIDHVAGLFSKALPTWGAYTFIPLYLSLLCMGTYRIVRSLSHTCPTSPLTSWFVSIGATLVVLAITGPDAVALSSLAWLPLLSVSVAVLATVLRAGLALGAAPLWLLSLFIAVEASMGANQLAPLVALAACFVGLTIIPQDDHKPLPQRGLCLILVLVCGPALYASLTSPPAPFPDYPHLAHLVPDDGLVGIIRPLIGNDYPLQIVDRGAVQGMYVGPSLVLGLLALCCFFMVRGRTGTAPRILLISACCIAAAAFLDTALPERFAVIAPLMSASRILPWGTSISLTPWALGFGAWLLCVGAGISLHSTVRVLSGLAVTFCACMVTQSAWRNPPWPKETIAAALEDESLRRVAISPSLGTIWAFERSTTGFLKNLETFKALAQQKMQTISSSEATLETSPLGNGRTLDRVADRSAHTRWTSNRSQQVGDEVLTFRFSHPTPTRGLELDPGEYSTDFPRGLTVRGGPCREEEARQLAYFPSWQGALSFTTDGFPYFSGQSDVRMLFGKEESVECIFVRQTSAAPFAWSVAEARMLPH